jgi:hypothetical protein
MIRRAVVRYPSGQDVLTTMNPSNSGFILRADVHELSTLGVSLLLRKKVPVGAVVSIDLPDEVGDTASVLEATVTNVTAVDKNWLLACTFSRHLTAGELKALA